MEVQDDELFTKFDSDDPSVFDEELTAILSSVDKNFENLSFDDHSTFPVAKAFRQSFGDLTLELKNIDFPNFPELLEQEADILNQSLERSGIVKSPLKTELDANISLDDIVDLRAADNMLDFDGPTSQGLFEVSPIASPTDETRSRSPEPELQKDVEEEPDLFDITSPNSIHNQTADTLFEMRPKNIQFEDDPLNNPKYRAPPKQPSTSALKPPAVKATTPEPTDIPQPTQEAQKTETLQPTPQISSGEVALAPNLEQEYVPPVGGMKPAKIVKPPNATSFKAPPANSKPGTKPTSPRTIVSPTKPTNATKPSPTEKSPTKTTTTTTAKVGPNITAPVTASSVKKPTTATKPPPVQMSNATPSNLRTSLAKPVETTTSIKAPTTTKPAPVRSAIPKPGTTGIPKPGVK